MLDPINPPTSPYLDSGPSTPLPSSQADFDLNRPGTEDPATQQPLEEPETKKLKTSASATPTQNGSPSASAASAGSATAKETATANTKKLNAEALRRRRENRQRAAAALAQNLKNSGVGRFEEENGFGLTSVRPIPLINQKNYYTEYLKKDEQISFIRNRRLERDLETKIKDLKKAGQADKIAEVEAGASSAASGKVAVTNFDDFDLNNIENELRGKGDVDDAEEEEDDEEETEEVREQKAKIGEDVIVIQPGSTYIRVGRATDAVPKVIPNVIAVRKKSINKAAVGNGGDNTNGNEEALPKREVEGDKVVIEGDFGVQRTIVSKDFRARMRYYKRRILPNSRETAANFNKKQEPEIVQDHNDPGKREWINPDDGTKAYYTGEDALKLVLNDNWCLKYPMINGNFNEYSKDYTTRQELLGDLVNIVQDALQGIDVANSKVMLIIPDLYDKVYVETWCEILLLFVGFKKLAILQEAVAATFGAGASTTCIVDVGAHTTKVSCVDEGLVVPDSRLVLNYGGDHVTEAFIKLLLESWFPYRSINLNDPYDWELAKSLKESFVTFQDADIAIQLYNFYRRSPLHQTEKYDFKVFDEVMLAPMGYFFPNLLSVQLGPALQSLSRPSHMIMSHLFSKACDQYDGKPNNPRSRTQDKLKNNINYCDVDETGLLMRLVDHNDDGDAEEDEDENGEGEENEKNVGNGNSSGGVGSGNTSNSGGNDVSVRIPLEKAIVESITNASLNDPGKMKKYYDNILIVGGGLGKIDSYDLILTDRINIWRPKYLSTTAFGDIIDFLKSEIKRNTLKKQQMIDEAKGKGSNNKENEGSEGITQEVMDKIDAECELQLDLDKIDQLADEGSVIPVTILPTPREFDPSMLTWKGGSVYGRLKVVNEMWISQKDWDLLGNRSLFYKSIFNY